MLLVLSNIEQTSLVGTMEQLKLPLQKMQQKTIIDSQSTIGMHIYYLNMN